MRAVVVEHLGEPGSLRDVPTPEPGRNEVLVRVTAAGVNPVDWKLRDSAQRPMPFVLGQDFSGVVVGVGTSVSRYDVGERVFGMARTHGSYAEYTLVPDDDREQPIAKIPDDVGDADAAALPTAGLTALAALNMLGVREGTKLVILGATGGVGSFAAQIARGRGARVAGTTRAENEALAREFGVEHPIAYDRDDVNLEIKRIFTGGAEAVLDLVDDADTAKTRAGVIASGGTIVSTIGALDEAYFHERNVRAHNLVVTNTPESSHEGLRTLAALLEDGTLHVYIAAEHDLREAGRALEDSKAGRVNGKVILTVETGTI